MTLPRFVSAQPPAPVFRAPAVFNSGGTTQYGLALGDVDSNALLDVAVVNDTSNNVTVFRNTGDWESAEPPQDGFQNYNPPNSPLTKLYALPPYTPGTEPKLRVAIGELDASSDNGPDMVVSMFELAGFAVFLNNGTGEFGAPTFVPCKPCGQDLVSQPIDVAIADFDNDGKNDIALAIDVLWPRENPPGTIRWPGLVVAWGNGTGTYTLGNEDCYPYPASAAYGYAWDMAVGDFNGSPGLLDIATCATGANRFFVFKNTGNASRPDRFEPQGLPNGFNGVDSYGVVAGRFRAGTNADDLVFTHILSGPPGSYWVRYFFNDNSQGTQWIYDVNKYEIPDGQSPRGIAVGKLNADSMLDVVSANKDGQPSGNGNVAVLLGSGNAGDPLVGTPYYYPLHVHPENTKPPQVVVGDVSNDGKDDVITASPGKVGISVLVQGPPPPP